MHFKDGEYLLSKLTILTTYILYLFFFICIDRLRIENPDTILWNWFYTSGFDWWQQNQGKFHFSQSINPTNESFSTTAHYIMRNVLINQSFWRWLSPFRHCKKCIGFNVFVQIMSTIAKGHTTIKSATFGIQTSTISEICVFTQIVD